MQHEQELVDQITSFFTDYFKRLGKLPEDSAIVDDIKVQSELHRILAIPDRLSYLAKGIVTTSARDDAKEALIDVLKLAEAVDKSQACLGAKQRAVASIADTEIDTIMTALGLKVEEDSQKDEPGVKKSNIIKRKASCSEDECISIDVDNEKPDEIGPGQANRESVDVVKETLKRVDLGRPGRI